MIYRIRYLNFAGSVFFFQAITMKNWRITSSLLTLCCGVFLSACTPRNDVPTESKMPAVDSIKFQAGQVVYQTHCATCHMKDGRGAAPMNPPLIKTSFVLGGERQLISIILNGMKGIPVDGEKYKNVMPAFAFLSDDEVANVLTYVRADFGNNAPEILRDSVNSVRITSTNNK